jgi:hypothetical protein
MKVVPTLLLVAALAACQPAARAPVAPKGTAAANSTGPAGAALPPEVVALADRTVALFDTLAAAVEKHRDSCQGMGDALERLFADNRKLLDELERSEATLSASVKDELERRYGERLGAAFGRITPALDACADNEHLRTVLEKGPI